jgi:hypothetical protein
MQNYVNCSKVYVDVCEFGYGVFANEDIKEGDIIEIGLMYIINDVDGNNNSHLFTWSDDRTIWAAGSGCLPFYNHSSIPNIKKIGDLVNNTMTIIALRDISKGEELRNTYMSSKWRKCFNNLIN